MTQTLVSLEGVSKAFGPIAALRDVSLTFLQTAYEEGTSVY